MRNARAWIGLWARRLATELDAEQARLVLWVPVLMGFGIAFYFGLREEPPWWTGVSAFLASLGLYAATRDQRAGLASAAVLCVALGFTAAQARTAQVAAAMVPDGLGPLRIEGRVMAIDRFEGEGLRVLLAEPILIGAPQGIEPPAFARVRLRRGDDAPAPGARISVRAVLRPPPGPAEPGAYDFRRSAYFQGIGAVGFALGGAVEVAPPDVDGSRGFSIGLERVREGIRDRVSERLDGAQAAVATALLNGETTGIPEADIQAFRVSGLQHLLSISGLHIGLVAGAAFALVRGILAAMERIALRRPIKKWAAVAAILAAGAYTILVGMPVPTQRAMVMTGLVMAAVLADRSPLSMRMIALAAVAVLLTQPEALVGPSFQMSFAAVASLIAAYETLGPRYAARRAAAGWVGKAWLHVEGLLLTGVVASASTLPFSLFHFQTVANYGVLANLIAVPITSILVMPAGMIALLAMPLGLEAWAVDAMGFGVAGILWAARWTAGLPGSALTVPAVPWSALALFVLGGAWVMIFVRPWRLLGCLLMALAVLPCLTARRPDVIVNAGGTVVGLRDAEGGLWVTSGRRGRFEAETWARRDGDAERPTTLGRRSGPGFRCDRSGCVRDGAVTVALPRTPAALARDCEAATVVIAPDMEAASCAAAVIIDRRAVEARGAHALWLSEDGVVVETTRARPRARPWN